MLKLVPALAITILVGASAAYATQLCISAKLKANLTGDWKGDDSYLLRIRKNAKGQTCFSIFEPGGIITRTVRDVVVANGELRHLTYYTPATNGYVVYSNIETTERGLGFDWFSSFDLQSGKDIYVRTGRAAPAPGS